MSKLGESKPKNYFLLPCILAPFFFWISWILTAAYYGGDQRFYHALYESLPGTAIPEALGLQSAYTGSSEPLYGTIMWLGANLGIDKDIYISFFNALLCCVLLYFLISKRANKFFILLLFSNFYLIVLLTTAERLKFSYLALLLASVSYNSRKVLFWYCVACLLHFQTIILLFAGISGLITKVRIPKWIKRETILRSFILLPAFLLLVVVFISLFSEQLIQKAEYYNNRETNFLSDVSNIGILMAISLLCLPNKREIFVVMVICVLFVFFLGGERVNMISVTLFIYFCIIKNKTDHPLVLLLMLYFSWKSYGFLENIFTFGNGFA